MNVQSATDAAAKAVASALPGPGAHGGDGAAVAAALGRSPDQLLDLSASLNPFGPDLTTVVTKRFDSLTRYPDSAIATSALAAAMQIDPDRLVLTNGGAEAIALVAAELGDGLVTDPDFSLYRRHLRTGNDPAGGRWLSNPSSPLGSIAAADERATVWDEAFWPMTMGTWTRGDDTAWRLGSLTKLWACPGLRLGYVIAPNSTAAHRIRDAQPRWAVNGLALAVTPELLANEDLPTTAERIRVHRSMFAREVASLGYGVMSGIAPWLLIEQSPGLRAALAASGLLVRDCTSFGLTDVHRIGLPPPEHVETVLAALANARRSTPMQG